MDAIDGEQNGEGKLEVKPNPLEPLVLAGEQLLKAKRMLEEFKIDTANRPGFDNAIALLLYGAKNAIEEILLAHPEYEYKDIPRG